MSIACLVYGRCSPTSAIQHAISSNRAAVIPVWQCSKTDYHGTGVSIGKHPMALYRAEFSKRGIVRAADLARVPDGRPVCVAGAVICRQRPATAKGFLFLSLEDETGIANAIVTPDLFKIFSAPLLREPFLLVEGILQNQQGAISVRVRSVESLSTLSGAAAPSHDFH